MKLDPIEIITDAGSFVIFRMVGFFGAGWLGVLTARLSAQIRSLSDALSPQDLFEGLYGSFDMIGMEVLAMVFWPLYPIFTAPSYLGAIYILVIILLFYVISSTESDLFKWLICLLVTQGIFSLIGDDFHWGPWIAMTFVIVSGVGSIYILHVWHRRPIKYDLIDEEDMEEGEEDDDEN